MQKEQLSFDTINQQQAVFGPEDKYIKLIENSFHVSIVGRDSMLEVTGESEIDVNCVKEVLECMKQLHTGGAALTEDTVHRLIEESRDGGLDETYKAMQDVVTLTYKHGPVKCKTLGQKNYVKALKENIVTFCIGPAGTGKTYLAMAMAITAFRNDEVGRIILTRPAIEAGEKLGFLPGDLQSKIDPYLRPLYDALYQIMGAESFQKNMEKGLIEVAPLAYMRGRTLDNAFIILDEAQNTTPAQMKMFLTRIGFGSKVIVTGDASQKDLPSGTRSGLDVAMQVLKKVDGISFCELTSKDVVRHPLVQKIVQAYDEYEKKAKPENHSGRAKSTTRKRRENK